MNSKNDLILEISRKNANINKFAKKIVDDPELRDEIVNLMLNHPQIMVYYHSYYIISRAAKLHPHLFYKYWDDFRSLLNHENSYHRDFALFLLANLTRVDREDKFYPLFEDYFSHIHDQKFSTAQKCIKNTSIILENKEKLREKIINILLYMDKKSNFPEKQKALLKADIIQVFSHIYPHLKDKKQVNDFVKAQLNSRSPKTRKNAKEFVENYLL
ncbi:hypothetical protein HYG87_01650 [Methanobacterium alkalithermotolerans]|uniref:Uncharacterized protein n=1 Tax=Methanobacterium alkalithermotolerans TaxID=2731220 RepID=A0A8T8KAY4_9EURY|nr:hypothetical protein [Methanobacterium alkalithermotolerans]QUH22561.1 hypothetical protein HYG87_01650 [Methanobacterium alkalithermotolerans]